ncbi:MAG: agmatine deiminase family protein [Idiomarina sp.]
MQQSQPLSAGFQCLPEWQQPGAVAALWPSRNDVWRQQAKPAQDALIELLEQAADSLPVVIGVNLNEFAIAKKRIPASFKLLPIPYNDAWMCDIAPFWRSYSLSEQPAQRPEALLWQFDAWQGLYPEVGKDNRCAQTLATHLLARWQRHSMVFEGGNFTTDGQGHALAVSSSVVRSGMPLSKVERTLKQQLGVERITWLSRGLSGDETQGHIDNIALFIDAETLLISGLPDTNHPDFVYLQQVHVQLKGLRNKRGQPYRIIELPAAQLLPVEAELFHDMSYRAGVLQRTAAHPVLASYVNVVNLGQRLLVPQFGVSDDRQALQMLQQQLPGWNISGVAAREFVLAGGGPHCMTHVIPASVWALAQFE